MKRPVFSAVPGGWVLKSEVGCLEWVTGLDEHPKAIFHHARPRWYDDEPMVCFTLAGSVCWPDSGRLVGYYLRAFESGNPRVIEQAMHVQWSRDRFDIDDRGAVA